MQRVFIIHGWDGSPEEPMHKWLRKELEEKRFKVIVPEMPNSEEPEIKTWTDKLKEIVINPDKNTYFIGHSIGCQAILRYLENLDAKIKIGGAIFIAPWISLNTKIIEEEDGKESVEIAKPWLETPILWDKIKKHINKFVCIFSDNDPYVPLVNKKIFEKKLSSKVIIENNKGHYTQDDNVEENPVVIKELLKISNIS
ncbi:MAG: alpha/beta hydrolase [Nanoarchaeota archaeon]|nr:alpha/beta hydrolase [Nanoarchaeota archaeon]MBU4116364.1 alpha/beta hydrolase [Nanoarchaeota archaeon]